jgi:hypothetical protein
MASDQLQKRMNREQHSAIIASETTPIKSPTAITLQTLMEAQRQVASKSQQEMQKM